MSLLRLCFLAGDEIYTKLGKVSHEDKHVVNSKTHGHKRKRCNHRTIHKERNWLRATLLTTDPQMVCVTMHGASGRTERHHWSPSQMGQVWGASKIHQASNPCPHLLTSNYYSTRRIPIANQGEVCVRVHDLLGKVLMRRCRRYAAKQRWPGV